MKKERDEKHSCLERKWDNVIVSPISRGLLTTSLSTNTSKDRGI